MERRKLILLTAAAVPAAVLAGQRTAAAAPPPGAPLAIAVQPLEAGDAAFAVLAPPKAGDPEGAKLVLRLLLTNTGTEPLNISSIEFAFPGGLASKVMQGVNLVLDDEGDNGVIEPGESKFWSNGTVELAPGNVAKNQVYLPMPAPASVTVRVLADGYLFANQVTLPLTAFGTAHRLPFDVADLRPGEVLVTSGDHWANGGPRGSQIYAHDVSVVGWNGTAWTRLLPGGDKSKNEDYRAYGLPVRSVAAGTVTMVQDGMAENTTLGEFPIPTPDPVGGNNVWVRHNDGTFTWYTHLQPGSIVVSAGQPVSAGQIIGLLGNTGNSSEPHIHLEVRRNLPNDAALRPMLFDNAWLVEKAAQNSWNPKSALWVPLSGRALPNTEVLIWPAASQPAWYPPGKPEIVQYGIPGSDYQSVFDRLVESGYKPFLVDAHEIGKEVFFNVIFRAHDGVAWVARHGLTSTQYQDLFNTMDREGFRLTNVTSYIERGETRYAAIFNRQGGPRLAAYHGLNAADHQAEFNTLVKDGFRPVNISIVSPGGSPRFTAFYHLEDVGLFEAHSFATAGDYQTAWNTNTKSGRHLTYFSAGQHSGDFRISAIFKQIAPGSGGTVGRHNLTGDKLYREQDNRLRAGFLTRTLGGYAVGSTAFYGGAWRR